MGRNKGDVWRVRLIYNMKKEPPYTLDTAVKLARIFEIAFKPNYHIALGGSCLHKGQSEKDIDLYVYPDSEILLQSADSTFIINKIREIGGVIDNVYLKIHIQKGYVNKPLIQFTFKGYPIDLFFIQWGSVGCDNGCDKTDDHFDEDVPF